MSAAVHEEVQVPRAALRAVAGLIAITLIVVAWSRLTAPVESGLPTARTIASRTLFFEDRPDGSVAVMDARTGRLADTLQPGADGFIRATLRTMTRERLRRGVGPEVPFELAVLEDRRVVLLDRAVGRSVDLEAFGSTNFAAFARLLAADAAPSASPNTPRKDPR